MAGKGHFNWYELMTDDPKAALAFYGSVVGWTGQTFDGPQDYTVLQAGEDGIGGVMPIPDEAKAAGARPVWSGYVSVGDVDAAIASLKAAGGSVHRQPWDIPGVGRIAMVADPQGATFMMMTPDGQARSETPPNTPGHTGWNELHTTDWEAAFGFYSDQFGWEKSDAMDMGEMGTYQIIAENGRQIGAMFNSSNAPRPMWLFYFNVPSIDAAVEKIKAGGGQVVNGPMQVPGDAWIVQATDPQGAMFALLGGK